jgi:hypothetical protein
MQGGNAGVMYPVTGNDSANKVDRHKVPARQQAGKPRQAVLSG